MKDDQALYQKIKEMLLKRQRAYEKAHGDAITEGIKLMHATQLSVVLELENEIDNLFMQLRFHTRDP